MTQSTPDKGAIRPLVHRMKTVAVTMLLAVTTATPTTAAAIRPEESPSAGTCLLPTVGGVVMSEGFPVDRSVFTRATGRVRALLLFVDFPDARARESASHRYREFFPAATKWFTTSSYGKLDYDPQPVLKYFRMPRGFDEYGIERGYGWRVHQRMMKDLLKVADKEVDFSRYDLVNVLVTPNAGPPASETVLSVTWTGATAAATDDGAELDRVSVLYGHDAAQYRVLNHENGHIFGLPDLYSGSDFRRTDRWAGQWDLMSLDWGMHNDLLAWHKRRLGWLDDGQVDCVLRRGTSEHTLSPVETPGGKKMVVIPASTTGAFALEVRSKEGNDVKACSQGVLLYWVRTDIPSGQGPVRVVDSRPDTSACEQSSTDFNAHNDAPFQVGERYHDSATSTTVRVVGKDEHGRYTVRVTKG